MWVVRSSVPLLAGLVLLLALPAQAGLLGGHAQWMAAPDFRLDEGLRAVAVDEAPGLVAGAGWAGPVGGRDALLVRAGLGDGRIRDAARLDDDGDAWFTALAARDGWAWAAGLSAQDGAIEALVAAHDGHGWAWVQRIPGARADAGARVALAGDMILLLATVADDVVLVAYDAATGALRWRSTWDGPGAGEDVASALLVDAGRGVAYVAGRAWGGAHQMDAVVLAFGLADGALRWEARHGSPAMRWDGANALALGPLGLYAAGTTWHRDNAYDLLALALDPTDGRIAWTARWSAHAGAEFAWALAASEDGRTVVAAGETWLGERDAIALALSTSDGRVLWSDRYDGAGMHDTLSSVVVRGGEALAVGTTGTLDTGHDLLFLGHDLTTGVRTRVVRHDLARGEDFGHAVALGPQGRVVLAGEGQGMRGTMDGLLVSHGPPRGGDLPALR